MTTTPTPEPFIHLQEYELEGTADCGCRLDARRPDGEDFYLCPLHAAAREMLDLLRGWLNGAETKNHAWLIDHAPSYTRALLAKIEGKE